MWTVTRQHQFPDGNFVVEISEGGLDYTNPDALSAKYPGEFHTFKSKVEAVKTAIEIAKAWRADRPLDMIEIATGGTGGMTMPFSGEPLTEEVFADLLAEAERVDEETPKCDQCGEILGTETWTNQNSEWSGCKFCSDNCAERAQEHDEETRCRICHGDNTDGEGYDGLCGNCADKRERRKFRAVEVARAWAGSEGDTGTWDTQYYDIPADTPEDKVNEVALIVADEEIRQNQIAYDALQYLWIYSIPDVDDEINITDEDEETEEIEAP